MKKPWWLLLLLACVSRADLHAQGALIPVAFYAVQGAPFSLTVQTQWNTQRAVGPTQGTQRILRDSAGRQRYEAPMIDGVPRPYTMTIYDVAGGKIIVLDPVEKTAHVAPMHVGRSVVLDVSEATSLPPATAAQNQTLLGVRDSRNGSVGTENGSVHHQARRAGHHTRARLVALHPLQDAAHAGAPNGQGHHHTSRYGVHGRRT